MSTPSEHKAKIRNIAQWMDNGQFANLLTKLKHSSFLILPLKFCFRNFPDFWFCRDTLPSCTRASKDSAPPLQAAQLPMWSTSDKLNLSRSKSTPGTLRGHFEDNLRFLCWRLQLAEDIKVVWRSTIHEWYPATGDSKLRTFDVPETVQHAFCWTDWFMNTVIKVWLTHSQIWRDLVTQSKLDSYLGFLVKISTCILVQFL